MLTNLAQLFNRDLQKLIAEIEAFTTEENIWKTSGNISNSSGNLALHLAGNLRTFIGLRLAEIDYERNREAEFGTRFLPKEELLQLLIETKQTVATALRTIHPDELEDDYPDNPLGQTMSVQHFLLHLLTHLNYHLGQINYLRRALE